MKTIKSLGFAIIALVVIASAPLSNNSDNDSGQSQDSDIVSIAAQTEVLSTLAAAVEAAGLAETLQSEGPFTVFAPTNEAFAALPDGTLESLLLEENRDKLIEILTYHVVPGKVLSSDLSDGMTAETAQGETLTITVNNYGVSVDDASVVQADVEASNGVVHIIDAVILPGQKYQSSY